MPLPRRIAVRRLLIGLLLLAALAGGVWWNATRLNETERKLVGVWVIVDETSPPTRPQAFVFLPNRNHYVANLDLTGGPWRCAPEPMGKWDAVSETLVLRPLIRLPRSTSLSDWQFVVSVYWNGTFRSEFTIVRASATEI